MQYACPVPRRLSTDRNSSSWPVTCALGNRRSALLSRRNQFFSFIYKFSSPPVENCTSEGHVFDAPAGPVTQLGRGRPQTGRAVPNGLFANKPLNNGLTSSKTSTSQSPWNLSLALNVKYRTGAPPSGVDVTPAGFFGFLTPSAAHEACVTAALPLPGAWASQCPGPQQKDTLVLSVGLPGPSWEGRVGSSPSLDSPSG